MKLNPTEIVAVAKLARLNLSPAEQEHYAAQLSVVFEYIERLNEVPTDTVLETCQVTGLEDITRADVAESCDTPTKEKLLKQFPESAGALLKVKAVFDT